MPLVVMQIAKYLVEALEDEPETAIVAPVELLTGPGNCDGIVPELEETG